MFEGQKQRHLIILPSNNAYRFFTSCQLQNRYALFQIDFFLRFSLKMMWGNGGVANVLKDGIELIYSKFMGLDLATLIHSLQQSHVSLSKYNAQPTIRLHWKLHLGDKSACENFLWCMDVAFSILNGIRRSMFAREYRSFYPLPFCAGCILSYLLRNYDLSDTCLF